MLPRRLRPWHLVASWIAWWLALFLYEFWRPLVTYWRVTHTPNGHGSASFEYSGNPLVAALWILGVPVLLTILWLLARRSGRGPGPTTR